MGGDLSIQAGPDATIIQIEVLRGIQSYLAGTFVLRNSTRGGIVQQLSFLETHELGDDYLRDYVQRIWAVTPADVQRIAATYLDPKKMTIVVAGDRKQIDAQLKPWSAAPGGKPKPKHAP
jgi:predicted Zn-dependent peptidase